MIPKCIRDTSKGTFPVTMFLGAMHVLRAFDFLAEIVQPISGHWTGVRAFSRQLAVDFRKMAEELPLRRRIWVPESRHSRPNNKIQAARGAQHTNSGGARRTSTKRSCYKFSREKKRPKKQTHTHVATGIDPGQVCQPLPCQRLEHPGLQRGISQFRCHVFASS